MLAHAYREHGILPLAGGLLDQPRALIHDIMLYLKEYDCAVWCRDNKYDYPPTQRNDIPPPVKIHVGLGWLDDLGGQNG